MLKSTDLYIDLGTANTLIYAKGRGFLLNEPSVLAVRRRGELFALGAPAKSMIGREPSVLSVHRPLREGVIADFDNTARMLHAFIKRARKTMTWIKPRMIISLPCRVTNFEKRAVEEVGYELGARKVHLLDEPVAAAIGVGLPVLGNRGQMIVDVGGGTTEIAVISLGGIIAASAVRVGGDNVDTLITNLLKNHYQFVIGEQTAERIKIAVANVDPASGEKRAIEAGGFSLTRGVPKKIRVDTDMIFPAADSVARTIVEAVKKALETCPPEIAGDLAETGLVLTGGGALLAGLRSRIEREVGIPVKVSSEPLLSVALGGAKALEDPRLFEVIERPA